MADPVTSHLIHTDANLIAAATRLRPELDIVEATMLSGAAWRIGFCSVGCGCIVRRAAEESREEDIARVGLRRKRGSPEVLQKSAALGGRRRYRDLQTLLEFSVWSLRAAVMDWCEMRRTPVLSGFGTSLYDLWMEALPAGANGFAQTAEACAALRRIAAHWLIGRAGQQRTPYAVRLRRAGNGFQDEADILDRLVRAPENRQLVQLAREKAEAAIFALTEAALMEAGIPQVVRSVLLEEVAEALTGTALQEILYLARAASRPLKVLAARRLAGGRGPQVAATLGQLLWEPYPPLADTALWALERSHPEAASRIALGTARGMTEEDLTRLRPPLLLSATRDRSSEFEGLIELLNEPQNAELLRPDTRETVQFIRGI